MSPKPTRSGRRPLRSIWAVYPMLLVASAAAATPPAPALTAPIAASSAPPPAASLRASHWRGEVLLGDDGAPRSVSLEVTVDVEVHQGTGWTQTPVLPGDAALIDATVDGRPAALHREHGRYHLTLQGAGPHRLLAHIVLPIAQGASSVALPHPPGGVHRLDLRIPAKRPLDLRVSGAVLLADHHADGVHTLGAMLSASGVAEVQWRPSSQQDAQPPRPQHTAEISTVVEVHADRVQTLAHVAHSFQHHAPRELSYRLGQAGEVLDVTGADLHSWRVDQDVLHVRTHQPMVDRYDLRVTMEQPLAAEQTSLNVTTLQPLHTPRLRGRIALTTDGHTDLTPRAARFATPTDPVQASPTLLGMTERPLLHTYRYLNNTPAIDIERRVLPEADHIDAMVAWVNATTTLNPSGERVTALILDLRPGVRSTFSVQLPKGAELWSVKVDEIELRPSVDATGRLHIPIPSADPATGLAGAAGVRLTYLERGPPLARQQQLRVTLPRFDLPVGGLCWIIKPPPNTTLSHREGATNLSEHGSYGLRGIAPQSDPTVPFPYCYPEGDDLKRSAQLLFDEPAWIDLQLRRKAGR